MLRSWIQAGVLLAAGAAGAETVVLEAVERGSFRWSGHELGSDAAYVTGHGARGVFVFDVSALEGAATSATLRIWSPADGFVNADPVERIAVYAVSADPAALTWDRPTDPAAAGTPPQDGTFWDLGTGQRLGKARLAAGFEGFVEVPLDAALLRVLDRADGLVALGVRADSLRKEEDEQVFANTGPGTGVPPPQLVVEIDPAAAPGPAVSLHVDRRRGSPHGEGSAVRPFATLATALDLATPGDVVLVAPGRYAETLIMKHGVEVRGAGADRTILDIDAKLPSLRCANGTLDGLFVWRGASPDVRGVDSEAVDCTNGASPTISNSRIGAAGSSVGGIGGSGGRVTRVAVAIRLTGSQALLLGSQIDGTIVGVDASPAVVESEVDGDGGAALSLSFTDSGAPPFRIERNRLLGNVDLRGEAPEGNEIVGNLFLPSRLTVVPFDPFGGGLHASAVGDVGLIASNTFFRTQGISFCEPPSPIPPFTGPLPHPTPPCADREHGATAVIANNVLAFGSRGILLDSASDPSIVRNDVFQNDSPFSLGPTGNYVGLPDRTGLDGNLSEDPQFGGTGPDDAVPAAGSPVLDAGADEFAATDVDLDGDPRLAGEAIDMGAQERQPGGPSARLVQVFAEGGTRLNALGLEGFLGPRKSFVLVIRSDPEFDAPSELGAGSLTLEGFAPVGRCRARDADQDGVDDLACSFPFEAIEALSPQVTRRFCLSGETVDGSPIRGCTRAHVLLLPRGALR